jgi:hypothetical protein
MEMHMARVRNVVAILAIVILAVCSKPSASTAAGGGTWTANGASACDKYLTRDVVTAILTNPAGINKQLSAGLFI